MDQFDKLFNTDEEIESDINLGDLSPNDFNYIPSLASGEFIEIFDFDLPINLEDHNYNIPINNGEDGLNYYAKDFSSSKTPFDDMCSAYRPGETAKNKRKSLVHIDFAAETRASPTIFDINTLAKELLIQFNYMNYGDKLFQHDDRIWVSLDFDKFKTHALESLDSINHESMSMRNLKELYYRLKCTPQIQVAETSYQPDPYYLCFRNGVLDIMEDNLLGHSPEFMFFSYINIDYTPVPSNHGMVFENFLESISNGVKCIKERLLEIIAYCISDFNNAKVIPLLVGDKNSGKSTFANLLSLIVGHENCFSISLSAYDKWTPARFFGKKLCLSTDLSNQVLSSHVVSELKQLSGGDLINAQEKNKDPFSFYNQCKMIFASNYMPSVSVKDKALEDRWLVVPFLHSFEKHEMDRNILHELEGEIPYIINLCIRYLRRLINNNFQFTEIGEYADIFSSDGTFIDLNQDIVIQDFISTKCIIDDQRRALFQKLYKAYCEYCTEYYGYNPISAITFSKALRRILGSAVKDGGRTDGRSLIGIDLKNI